MTMPLYIYRPRLIHRTWNWINQFSSCRVTASTRILAPYRNIWICLMGLWPRHCSSTSEDSSIEFQMEKISPAVVEWWLSQHEWMEWQTEGQTVGWMDGQILFCIPLAYLWKGDDNEFDMQLRNRISYLTEARGHFKNAYEFVNLGALKFTTLYQNHIFQCMGKIFWVEFQRYPLKFHTKYRTHTLKNV